jgi:pimeloyl-ACP methyl ester carboxylesterase
MAKYLLLLLLFGYAVCFSQSPDSAKPIGRLVDVGGYKLHVYEKGAGKHTIVFLAGSKAFSFDWILVQDEAAKFARTLSYDRPGLAWSDPGPMPRTFAQDCYELHTLLRKIKIDPPYILVGHSLGAIIARQYTRTYPTEVEGLVLVDPTSENTLLFMNNKVQRLRDWASKRPLPKIKTRVDTLTKIPTQKELDDFLKMAGMPRIEPPFDKLPGNLQEDRLWAMKQPKYMIADNGQYWADEFEKIYEDSVGNNLGDRPLVILSSILNIVPKNAADSARMLIAKEKERNHALMAKLSVNGKIIATDKSGHEIHLSEPDSVTDAIKTVIEYKERVFGLKKFAGRKTFSLKQSATALQQGSIKRLNSPMGLRY